MNRDKKYIKNGRWHDLIPLKQKVCDIDIRRKIIKGTHDFKGCLESVETVRSNCYCVHNCIIAKFIIIIRGQDIELKELIRRFDD